MDGAKSVLSAAALTYIAALAQSLLTLLYYVFLLTGSGRRR
ncbi:MAG TPA: zinc metallopeptidase [Anaerolineae bacterium]|nr:zinc metallopeptidase [Anaerolineae bacterium]